MRTAIITLTGETLVQSRFHGTEKLPKEGADDYEQRTWRNKVHANNDGECVLFALSIKNCLRDVAKFLSVQIPGKGKSTYTKHFKAGVVVPRNPKLGVHKNDVEGEWRHVPASGVAGDGKRVMRCFPIFRNWKAECEVVIIDDTITPEVFEQHLVEAGRLVGIGSFRPINGGIDGRFEVESIQWI